MLPCKAIRTVAEAAIRVCTTHERKNDAEGSQYVEKAKGRKKRKHEGKERAPASAAVSLSLDAEATAAMTACCTSFVQVLTEAALAATAQKQQKVMTHVHVESALLSLEFQEYAEIARNSGVYGAMAAKKQKKQLGRRKRRKFKAKFAKLSPEEEARLAAEQQAMLQSAKESLNIFAK